MSDGFYAYVGVLPCGCRPMCCVDKPEYQKDTAKFVSGAIKNGCTVERVFVPAGESIGIFRCKHKPSNAITKDTQEKVTEPTLFS